MKPSYQFAVCALAIVAATALSAAPEVSTERVPYDGKRAKVLTDKQGNVHLIFNNKGNVFYTRKSTADDSFPEPLQVNSIDGCAAVAELALGVDGRAHVIYHGNIFYIREQVAKENRKLNAADIKYTFYSRLNDEGTAFEQQVDVSGPVWGFDGGCTLASDGTGNVYVFFAGTTERGNETVRQVFMRRSTDDGKSFEAARPIDLGKGVCACCHLKATFNHQGELMIAYRVAEETINRDSYVLTSSDGGETFRETPLDQWELRACPGSVYAFADSGNATFVSLRNKDEIYLKIEGKDDLFSPPNREMKRRAAVMAGNTRGEVLIAWGEGENFNNPHDLRWQVYDAKGNTIGDIGRAKDALSRWGNGAIYTKPNGDFVILH